LVTLTKAGVRAVDAAMEELLGRERNFLAPLTSEEKKELARLLSIIAAQFEDEI
jgi:DNA-binding MarR family transcriptional regulator